VAPALGRVDVCEAALVLLELLLLLLLVLVVDPAELVELVPLNVPVSVGDEAEINVCVLDPTTTKLADGASEMTVPLSVAWPPGVSVTPGASEYTPGATAVYSCPPSVRRLGGACVGSAAVAAAGGSVEVLLTPARSTTTSVAPLAAVRSSTSMVAEPDPTVTAAPPTLSVRPSTMYRDAESAVYALPPTVKTGAAACGGDVTSGATRGKVTPLTTTCVGDGASEMVVPDTTCADLPGASVTPGAITYSVAELAVYVFPPKVMTGGGGGFGDAAALTV
jgi:hypothetical protein